MYISLAKFQPILHEVQLSFKDSLTVHQLQSKDEATFHVIRVSAVARPVQYHSVECSVNTYPPGVSDNT